MPDCQAVQSRIMQSRASVEDEAHADACPDCGGVRAVVSVVRGDTPAAEASGERALGSAALVGRIVRGYRIERALGSGGFGTVYLAVHLEMGRRAAIKVLRPALAHEPAVLRRFFNEARAANAVRHPAIVDIYDYGQEPDFGAYLIMEYLEGETLSQRIGRTGPMAPADVERIVRRIGAALSAAHAVKLVHRDLKPDNVFLVEDVDHPGEERVKLLDFGIAKLSLSLLGAAPSSTTGVLGTPAYMSPEQCDGAAHVDHRSDQYALGVIAYEMLAGRPPFLGGVGKVMALHQTAPPPAIATLRRDVPPAVEAVVMKALAKEPADRHPTVAEMTAALRQALGAHGDPSRELKLSDATPSGEAEPPPAEPTPRIDPGPAGTTTLTSSASELVSPRRRRLVLRGLTAAGVVLSAGLAGWVVVGQVVEPGGDAAADAGTGGGHDDTDPAGADPASAGRTRADPKDAGPGSTRPGTPAPERAGPATPAPESALPASAGLSTAAPALVGTRSTWSGALRVTAHTFSSVLKLELTGAAGGRIGTLTRTDTYRDPAVEVPDGMLECTVRYAAGVTGKVDETGVTYSVTISEPATNGCRERTRTWAGSGLSTTCTRSGRALDCKGALPARLLRR